MSKLLELLEEASWDHAGDGRLLTALQLGEELEAEVKRLRDLAERRKITLHLLWYSRIPTGFKISDLVEHHVGETVEAALRDEERERRDFTPICWNR